MKTGERWIVLAAVLAWPFVFAIAIGGTVRPEPWLSNLLLMAGWAVILGIFVWRIYQSAAFLRADVAREQSNNPEAVVSAAILKTADTSTPKEGFIIVLVADAEGIRLIGLNSSTVGSAMWANVLKLTPLDRNIMLLIATPEGGTEEWRLTPAETGLIRAVSIEKRDTLVAQLEGLRVKAA